MHIQNRTTGCGAGRGAVHYFTENYYNSIPYVIAFLSAALFLVWISLLAELVGVLQ